MNRQSIYDSWQRYRTLFTHHIYSLPIVILMPHSACNCRCVMCDIWKGNKNLKQLNESDLAPLLQNLEKFHTQQVVMSGGEALLNPVFFRLCELIKSRGIRITLLSTGLLLKRNVENIIRWVDDVIISLDGDKGTHDRIRNLEGAFEKMKEGVQSVHQLKPGYKVTGRSVIHRLNFKKWQAIIEAAKEIGLKQISFLPADVSSHAFNRELLWDEVRQHEILPAGEELPLLNESIENIIAEYAEEIRNGFIAESAEKLRDIARYYHACYGHNPFPFKKCNAPWVSAVVDADGSVKPCFFHPSFGNIREQSLAEILNGPGMMNFRRSLDMSTNPTCVKCVCSLNLPPRMSLS